jgi:hypothetical protein
MKTPRLAGGARVYRLPCGESLTSLLQLPDKPRSGTCPERMASDHVGEFNRPVNAFSTAKAPSESTDADWVADMLCFDHATAASLDWALGQYFRLLDVWFSAPNCWSSLGPCSVWGRGDIHDHRGERRR